MPIAFFGEEFMFTQPDGTKIPVRGWGNQNVALFEDMAGYTLIQNSLSGYYEYAKMADDRTGLELSGAVAGVADPGSLGLEKHLRVPEEERTKRTVLPRSKAFHEKPKPRWQVRREEERSAQRSIMGTRGITALPPPGGRTGSYVGICLLIQFADIPGTIPQPEVENFCNQTGYKNFGNNGSVYDYFLDVSGGKFQYRNIVTAYYTAKNPRHYYTDPGIPFGLRAEELVREALENLKTGGSDCSTVSADRDGYIYAVNAFFAGPCVNTWCKGLWPHSGTLVRPFDMGANRRAKDYQITHMGDALELAVFCHENGHMVCDFPDLYDYGGESGGVGVYCLMSGGIQDKRNPAQICAYLKYRAGWAGRVTPVTPGQHAITAGMNDFFIHKRNETEYYLIEARLKEKRDLGLPASGLAIWHVDEQGSNENQEMTPRRHYECSLVQADNRFDLERRVNLGDERDLFAAPACDTFGAATKPASQWWSGIPSGLELTGISPPRPVMNFTVPEKTS